jgi:hypothetical protein
MSTTGSSYSAMFNVSDGRFDKLEVWDGAKYVNVAVALNTLAGLSDLIAADDARITALETKQETLDNTKADKFVAQSPLFLKSDVTPNELYAAEPPPPISANAIVFNGTDGYFEFDSGRADVMDYTHDWSLAVSVVVQGQGTEGSNLTTFGTGTNSLNLKVQGPPLYNSNYGSYNSTADNLYDAATRFNANTWRAPTDDSRLVWVYTAATKKLQYFTSYEIGSYQRWANISVPQTAVDVQTVGPEMTFSKSWVGSPSSSAWSGTANIGTFNNWVLSDHAWSPVELTELFSQSSDVLPTLTFYHKVSSWIKPGVYPAVYDVKGVLSGGVFHNGLPTDFVLL